MSTSPLPEDSPRDSRKRSSNEGGNNSPAEALTNKRQRVDDTGGDGEKGDASWIDEVAGSAKKVVMSSPHHQAKEGLRRSVALALQCVGFDSATPEAMESLLSMVETCKFRDNPRLASLHDVLRLLQTYHPSSRT